jgi:hypothetical protein
MVPGSLTVVLYLAPIVMVPIAASSSSLWPGRGAGEVARVSLAGLRG